MTSPLGPFSPATRAWFEGAFAAPTDAQAAAWRAVSQGDNALVIAPTGSGKTLAAFLWSLDRLASTPPPDDRQRRCRVLYVSPLKALAVDIERNLRSPLTGIRRAAHRLGLPEPDIRVAVRSGDTPADERRRFGTHPPDILITTPESLFLLLTSRAREALQNVETVIVDEVHAVVGTKRGAHLALSLERLDALLDRPARRIGLSATVRPADEVASFLGGTRRVTVVQPPQAKTIELSIVVPVEDMAELGQPTGDFDGSALSANRRSIWPHVEERLLDLIDAHRSTIVFANSRRLAERLCARLNELAYERHADAGRTDPPDGMTGDAPRADEADATTAAARGAEVPAEIMAQAGSAAGVPGEVARAHHGSVSKEERARIENDLKAGRLPAVVATSSLELGIDMGAVDLVVQVESPPSVASGMQRIGRAGHQVGAISRGVIFPKYRGDLIQTAVVAERMDLGAIEELRYPRNPLDVLAQQIVAMVAMDEWRVDDLAAVVRRAAPFGGLPTSALESVLDMLAGRYPSDEFAELRPRLVWDRVVGTLRGRPGAQRLAATSGGTIPDRGLFGTYLAGQDGAARGGGGRRVGELDEEMVYESRVGDVFVLGATSWRIEDITADRVLVSPAAGQPGKLPFWKGDAPGRPVELGRAVGAFVRELGRLTAAKDGTPATERVRRAGLDAWAADNLVRYLDEQREATGHVPDDRTFVVERFRDELGDWRIVVHSPFGAPVHAPWALAIGARLRERYGVDVQAVHADDGIVLRVPDTAAFVDGDPGAGFAGGDRGEAPPTDVAVFDPDEIEQIVTEEVAGSALFAARFRECAARALLLPRRRPDRRTPLWQQRQRAAQLLQVASRYGSFPVVLETMRECLQDVFDVPGLIGLMRDVEARRIRFVEVETQGPSPFARSLLFRYVGAFMYEGDAPLAERRAQALTLDTSLLAELLGGSQLRELLDAEVVAQVDRELQRLTADRRVRDVEDAADLLRTIGPLSTGEAVERGTSPRWLAELEDSRRAIRVRVAGEERWAAVEDSGRLRDALGVPLPVGIPEAFLEPFADPLGDLVARYARTRGPFHASSVAARYGLGIAVVVDALRRLASAGRLAEGEFMPVEMLGRRTEGPSDAVASTEWCDAEVLRMLRRRSLARLRKEVEPSPPEALGRFLPAWHHIGARADSGRLRGLEALVQAVEQLQGAAVPASALETLVLPARVPDYSPALLDELTAAGEVVWAGRGPLPGNDGWMSLYLADHAPLLRTPADEEQSFSPLHDQVLEALAGGGALFFRMLSDRVRSVDDRTLVDALWDLVWAGRVTNDTLAPLRVLLGAGRSAHRSPRSRRTRRRPALPSRTGPPTAAGRWWALPEPDPDPTRRAQALGEALLDRHGVVTRGAVAAERVPGGFAAVYRVLTAFEDSGRCRRGYFVEGLGAAQFALPGAVDRMRTHAQPYAQAYAQRGHGSDAGPDASRTAVLAATDPANPYGAALAWPERPGTAARTGEHQDVAASGHKPGRKAGAVVVLVDGALVLYVERGGRTLLSWSDDPGRLQPAVDALALAVRDGVLGRLTVERTDGEPALESPLGEALEAAGFHPTPRGLRLRA